MNYTVAVPGVFVLTLYRSAFCRRVLARANREKLWQDAAIYRGPDLPEQNVADPAIRSASVLPLADLPEIGQAFEQSVYETVTPLVSQVYRMQLSRYGDAHIVRYRTGGQYLTHQDSGPGAENRFFTILCYLNDDFSGGATQFPDLDYSQKPETGKAILFPADYRHAAEPVTSGCKYVLVAWLLGPDPIRWI